MSTRRDRSTDNVGNITAFEHVNVTVPDLDVATAFYVNGLGFTRDPFIEHGPDLIWINVGRQQFHIPRGPDQRLRGRVDVAVPDTSLLVERLAEVRARVDGTEFSFEASDDVVEVRGPWGNRFRCSDSADIELGLLGVTFHVGEGQASAIGRFYEKALGAFATTSRGACRVIVGPHQALTFVETDQPIDVYDGHHIAIYVADFGGPHEWLAQQDLLEQDDQPHEYRFNWIVDPDSGERLFELEHEVRSLYHPLRDRPLINRNPEQRQTSYVIGGDQFAPRRS